MKKTIDVANVLLQNSKSEILLLQRSPKLKRGFIWGMPGGMIDSGETAIEAATRELAEETGIIEAELSITGILKFLISMPDENIRISNIKASLVDGDASIKLDPDEHIAYKWSSESEIYASHNLLPCLPTMVSESLGSEIDQDNTVTPGTIITVIRT